MMENAGPDFAGQSVLWQVVPTVIRKTWRLLLAQEKKKSHSLSLSLSLSLYPFDWRTKKPIIWRAVPQWLPQYQNSVRILDEVKKWKIPLRMGESPVFTTWFVTVVTGSSRQRAWGVPLPIFYAEDGTPIHDSWNRWACENQLFESMVPIIWWERDAKDLLPEGFTTQVHQMKFKKKLTSWTFGLTQVHHGMGLWLTVRTQIPSWSLPRRFRPIPLVGSTHLWSLLWRTMV